MRAPPANMDLGHLYRRYGDSLRRMLTQRGCSGSSADDILHGFLLDVVIKRRLLDRVDWNGREDPVRGLLVKALREYAIDVHRSETARRKRDARAASRTGEANAQDLHVLEADLDTAWATELLRDALRRTEAYLRGRGLDRHWTAFELRIIRPAVSPTKRPSVTDLAKQLRFDSPAQLSGALLYVKRRIGIALRSVLAEGGAGRDQVDDLLLIFRRILAGD